MRRILSYLVLFIMIALAAYPQSESALLLNPHGDGNTHWKPNSQYDCGHLKPRLSYLAGTTSANMVSFKRVSVSEGMAATSSPDKYYRRTCLSTSYDVDWVEFPNAKKKEDVVAAGSNIDPANPTIVYAYSVPHVGTVYRYDGIEYTTPCYDVYWYSEAEHPKLEGECYNLFQNGNKINNVAVGSMLEDVSGIDDWDFSGVTSMFQMFTNCQKLTELGFTNTKDLRNVTNLTSMFLNCYSLDFTKFQDCFANTWMLNEDKSKIKNRSTVFGNNDFKNKDITSQNPLTFHIDDKFNLLDDASSTPNTEMRFNMELATQIGRFTKVKWDMLYEENVGSYDIEYKKEGDESFVKMTTIDDVGENVSSVVSYYDYIWNEVIVDGVYDFRVKANIVGEDEPLISNVFSLDYSATGISYPACYTILKNNQPYEICTDEYGDIILTLSPDNPVEHYEVPSDVIIVCENFTVKVAGDTPNNFRDHCSSTFINNGEIYANKDITLYSNSQSTISYSCDGVYVADNMLLYGYKQPFKGIYEINKVFNVIDNHQGQNLEIDNCARISAYEGNFQHSGGQMYLIINGELIVDVLKEGNIVKVNEGGMLIAGQSNIDPTLRIIGMTGSLMRLCYNPTNGKDNLGFTNGTVYYNDNPLNGWEKPDTDPIRELDINDRNSNEYNTYCSMIGASELTPTVLAVYRSYEACMDPLFDPVALAMPEDPFLPQDKEVKPLYDLNPCSPEFDGQKIYVREFNGGAWLRLINGQLIYCENDNPQR